MLVHFVETSIFISSILIEHFLDSKTNIFQNRSARLDFVLHSGCGFKNHLLYQDLPFYLCEFFSTI